MLDNRHALRDALKRAASAMKADGPDFALAGSYALWAYGAPEPVNDVDLVVAEHDADAAAAVLGDAGFDIERTPEDWLFKARTNGVVVDVLHRVNRRKVDDELISAAAVRDVLAVPMRVLSPTMVLCQKLRSLDEHYCDFSTLLPATRAVREQVDWDRVRSATSDNDFASAFLFLAERLGLVTHGGGNPE